MREKIVAIIGGLLILASALIGLAWAAYWEGTHPVAPNAEEMEIWRVAQNVLGLTPEQALYLSLGGLLLGVACLIPWWRERRRQETLWYEKRDEPLDTPPPAGM